MPECDPFATHVGANGTLPSQRRQADVSDCNLGGLRAALSVPEKASPLVPKEVVTPLSGN